MQAIHAKKLEQALRSHERFPINLEWMVDVFKYKHISSLTTHLKRHFKMNVHYKRFAQEQNKRVWTYFISVECFIGICEYVRHAARKKIANVWLRKVGIKAGARRTSRDYDDDLASASEDDDIEEDEEEEEEGEEEGEYEEDLDYDYYEHSPKRRRVDDDEEYRCEEDEDEETEERSYFKEMEEEEACVDYETDGSVDYESGSSRANSPSLQQASGVPIPSSLPSRYGTNAAISQFRIIASSSTEELGSSSDSISSSESSAPSSPTFERIYPTNPPAPNSRVQTSPTITSHVPECEIVPSNAEMLKENVDWSYLHLRPNPHPLGSMYDFPAKHLTSVMYGQQYFPYPQQQQMLPYYVFTPQTAYFSNCHSLHFPMVVDPNGYPLRTSRHDMDNLHEMPKMEERHFDTNMFLSLPEEHHYFNS
jgi:hypothetical protein